jgi:hypothetical protein
MLWACSCATRPNYLYCARSHRSIPLLLYVTLLFGGCNSGLVGYFFNMGKLAVSHVSPKGFSVAYTPAPKRDVRNAVSVSSVPA